ncbi:MAG: hypothetical protein ABI947_18460 [Chloroflexota bacterium]
MAKTIIGLYDSINNARDTIQELVDSGFSRDRINVLLANSAGNISTQCLDNNNQPESEDKATLPGVNMGATGGATVGALTGLIAGLGALAIPGIGPVLAAGPLFGAFFGAATGSVAGGLIGAMTQWGIAEGDAPLYVEGIRNGGTLVVVKAEDSEVDRATAIITRHHLLDIHHRNTAESSVASGKTIEANGSATINAAAPLGTNDSTLQAGKIPGTPSFEVVDGAFQQHYRQTFANSGQPYEHFQPAYEFGYNLANDGRYQDGDWSEIESDIRDYWEQFQPGAWDHFKEAVHFARERALQGTAASAR